jgi:putative FmdB family regulatory protein
MPIYEYRCTDCGKRNSVLILSVRTQTPPSCNYCQSARLERLMSRFAAPKSEEARLEALADPGQFGDLDENDPKTMARFMKKMGREMGEDLGDDLDEALEGAGDDATGLDSTDMD